VGVKVDQIFPSSAQLNHLSNIDLYT